MHIEQKNIDLIQMIDCLSAITNVCLVTDRNSCFVLVLLSIYISFFADARVIKRAIRLII